MSNNQKLREALELCDKIMSDVVAGTRDISPLEAFDEMGGIIDKALAAPLRNCEVGSAEEQYERLESFCTRHFRYANDNPCAGCPLFKDDSLPCVYRFLQMPYEKGGAE